MLEVYHSTSVPVSPPSISDLHCGKTMTAKRILICAPGRETQKILIVWLLRWLLCVSCCVAVTRWKMMSPQQGDAGMKYFFVIGKCCPLSRDHRLWDAGMKYFFVIQRKAWFCKFMVTESVNLEVHVTVCSIRKSNNLPCSLHKPS